jgi:hypothetical protein
MITYTKFKIFEILPLIRSLPPSPLWNCVVIMVEGGY